LGLLLGLLGLGSLSRFSSFPDFGVIFPDFGVIFFPDFSRGDGKELQVEVAVDRQVASLSKKPGALPFSEPASSGTP